MKKRFSSFAAGAMTATMIMGLCGTALAANGNVSFSFANIALDGQVKYSAGSTITAPNGQQVPSSILYTDAAGGKTNYLPIRAVTELLNTDIGYDSASKTVLLGEQPAKADGTVTKTSAGKWTREMDHMEMYYHGDGPETVEGDLPACTPAWLPEGYTFSYSSDPLLGQHGNAATRTEYRKDTQSFFLITCARPTSGSFNLAVKADPAEVLQEVTVQGYRADLYLGSGFNTVVWEDENGTLFIVESLHVDRETLLRVAENLTVSTSQGTGYQLTAVPEGYTLRAQQAGADQGAFRYGSGYKRLSFQYAGSTALDVPAGRKEAVTVNGNQGTFYPDATAVETVGQREDAHNGTQAVTPVEGEVTRPVLIWTNEAGVTFRLQGGFSKEELVRMAGSVKAGGR